MDRDQLLVERLKAAHHDAQDLVVGLAMLIENPPKAGAMQEMYCRNIEFNIDQVADAIKRLCELRERA